MGRRAGVLAALAVACGDPSGATLPGRDEIGPPPEAAQPELCLPPFPMQVGNGYVLLADLDRGEACYAYLERDECVLGIFEDCTDDRPVPRQWRGRVDLDVDGASVVLQAVDDAARNPTVLPRSPVCCEGEIDAPDTAPWARLDCRLVRCGNDNDVQHAGLYFERYDPDRDPQAAVRPPIALPGVALGLAAGEGAVWAVTGGQLLELAGGAATPRRDLGDGRGVAAWAGAVYALDGATVVGPDGPPISLATVGRRIAASDRGAVIEGEDDRLWALAGGAVTASVAAPGEIADLVSGPRPRLALARDPEVREVQDDLTFTTVYDAARHLRRTGSPVFPAPLARGGAPAFAARCHGDARKTHCVFETADPETEARRFGLAGVEAIRAVHLDPETDRWITVGERGQVTAVDRASGRPLLQAQVRLDLRPGPTALAGRSLYVADADAARVAVVALDAFD